MNDATEPVDGEPWLAPGADGEEPWRQQPPGLTSEITEVELDGRRWEIPPEWLEPRGGVQPPSPPTAPAENTAPPVEALDAQIAAFNGVDWRGWAWENPQAAGAAFKALSDLTDAREQALAGQAETQAQDQGQRLQAAHAELSRDIEGWSPQLAADIAAYGQARGFTADELSAVEDPREVKILHLAMLGEQALARQQHEQRFGRYRPPTQVGGRGHPGALPSDKSSAEAWMQARRTQLRKKARS